MFKITESGISRCGKKVYLCNMERRLLEYFLEHPNVALSREKIMREVWGYEEIGASRTIDAHVKLLRRHLREFGPVIATIRGVGYRMEWNDDLCQ